jgi:outer membrane protein OmpA-like peptidoglycan-associated protein
LGGILKRVEPGSVSVPVIVNGKLTRLPAIHAKGLLAIEQSEFYFLDDPQNPLTLRFKIGKASLTVIKINFPGGDEPVNGALGQAAASTPSAQSGEHIERSLASKGRAEVYGIYFSLGSDRIRPESAPVLKDIADALNQHSAWKLNVEGHTDNVGGNAYNQDLSVRRSAAVKRALVERYHISPGRLGTAGFGASRPKATNDTLEGRALNRRVELVKRGES